MTLIKKIFIELSSCFKGGPEAENGLEIGTENDYACGEICRQIIIYAKKNKATGSFLTSCMTMCDKSNKRISSLPMSAGQSIRVY